MSSREAIALTSAEQARVEQIGQLVAQGAAGVPGLLGLLTERSWSVRREAVRALAAQGQVAAGALCELLRTQRDDEARLAAAVDALVASPVELIEPLTALAHDPNPAVAADAAQVLGRRRNVRAVPVLAGLVRHEDDNVSVAAIEALGRIGGPQALDALVGAAQSGHFFRVFPAIDVLGRCGDPRAIPPLAALASKPMYQLEAARALGHTGESAAVSPLAKSLGHSNAAMLRVTAVALAELLDRHLAHYGNQDAPRAALHRAHVDSATVGRLTRCIPDATHEERLAIAVLLGALGGEEAAAGLRSLLDSSGGVSEAAALSLKRLGKESDQQVREALRAGDSARRQLLLPIVTRVVFQPELVECLKDEDPAVRALACDALGRVGATGAVAPMFELLSDSNRRVVQAAVGAIQSLGSADTRALALHFAAEGSPEVRRRALQILSYFGFPETLPMLLKGVEDPEVATREVSLTGLALLDAPEAVDALLRAASAPEEKIRGAAMRALGQAVRSDPRVERALVSALDDRQAWVRYYACQALGVRAVDGAARRIAALLDDEAGQVRVAAIEALSQLKGPEAHEALATAARGDDPDMQRAALIGLGHSKQPGVLPLLLAAVVSPAPATRLVALSALAGAAPLAALSVLKAAARDADENVRSAALGFLTSLPVPGATAALIELAAVPADRAHVAPLLSVPAEGRVAALFSALQDADDELAATLASALVRLHNAEASGALMRTLSAGPVPARKAAAASLASLHSPAALAALARAAQTDPDAQVRQICGVLLSN